MKLYYFLVLLYMLMSCKTAESPVSVSVTYTDSKVKLSDIAYDYDIIQFESSAESAIGSIKKLSFMHDVVYVLDKQNNCILSFDRNGRFLNTSKKLMGKAKGEYISIEDMAVDEETSMLYVYCDRPNKILILDSHLELVREKPLSVFPIEITVCGQYLYCYCYEHDDIRKRSLVRMDKDMEYDDVEILYQTSETIPGVDTFGASLCGNGTDRVDFCTPFMNTIISRKGEVVTTHYLDFGNKWFSYEGSEKMQPREFFRNNDDRIWAIKNLCAGERCAIFTTNQSSVFVYDVEEHRCICYKGIVNNMLPLNSPFVVSSQRKDGHVAFCIPVSSVLHIKEEREQIFPLFEQKYDCRVDSVVESMIDRYTEASNPIVVVYKLK